MFTRSQFLYFFFFLLSSLKPICSIDKEHFNLKVSQKCLELSSSTSAPQPALALAFLTPELLTACHRVLHPE